MNKEQIKQVLDALKKLSFAAQTSGGTAGRDEALCDAIADTVPAIAALDAALAAPSDAKAAARYRWLKMRRGRRAGYAKVEWIIRHAAADWDSVIDPEIGQKP